MNKVSSNSTALLFLVVARHLSRLEKNNKSSDWMDYNKICTNIYIFVYSRICIFFVAIIIDFANKDGLVEENS